MFCASRHQILVCERLIRMCCCTPTRYYCALFLIVEIKATTILMLIEYDMYLKSTFEVVHAQVDKCKKNNSGTACFPGDQCF